MKKSKFYVAVLAAAMAMPALAQDGPVVINGSLINWYYFGKDYTGSTSGEGWHQQPTGGGAWIEWKEDGTSVTHPTGAANYGLLSLTLDPGQAKPLLPNFLIRNHVLYSNCGGLYMGGNEYYSFFGHEAGFGDDLDGEYGSEEYEILVRKWTWDGVNPDGTYSNVKYEQVGKLYNQPTDLTYDPENDIVYGVFSTSDGNYKLGTLNMSNFQVSWISREAMPLLGELRTLACNSKGELYGTDKSGNIFHVDKTDGKLTTIGNMGFNSQTMMMSATFDYRTDKMYWLGFVNNGKNSAATDGTNTTLSVADGGRDTGLYEIDVETGEAKLIGKTDFMDVEIVYDEDGITPIDAKVNKYGKMQMTGIYVEGSIVKYANDLKVSIDSYPQQLKGGEEAQAKVTVKNLGTARVRGRNYSVSLYADGKLMGTIDDSDDEVYTDNLAAGESQTFTFSFKAPNKSGDCVLKAVVEFAADERQKNNTAEAIMNVLANKIEQELILSATEGAKGLLLKWNALDGNIVDGAEDYVAFSYDNLCDWTMIDGDGGYTQKPQNMFSSVDYPNWNTPKAFIVMNPEKAGLSPDVNMGGEKFMPYAGNQYFAAFYGATLDGIEVNNNDYMVSPTLSGEAQTVSFWAKGYRGTEAPGYETDMRFNETIEVLYTTDEANLDPTTYEVAVEEFAINDKEWQKYTANLPAGAKHFALHRTSKARETQETELGTVEIPGTGSFIMMIDDISFRIKSAKSYNVYRGREVIANTTDLKHIVQGTVKNGERFVVAAVDADGKEFATSNVFVFNTGDVNGDNQVNNMDFEAMIESIANGNTSTATDVNGDGKVDIADIMTILNKVSK